jgi:adenylate cyclase
MVSDDSDERTNWTDLQKVRRTVLMVDIVESVSLMERYEEDLVTRWRAFVHEVCTAVLPAHRGSLVKSLGDGLMLEFAAVPDAVAAALDIQRRIAEYNADRSYDAHIHLRAAAHVSELVKDTLDIHGRGVNLTARLMTLATAGELVVSADVRDELLAVDDLTLEDLGDCELRGIQTVTRAYRVRQGADDRVAIPTGRDTLLDARPTVAVLPLTNPVDSPEALTLAELATDQLIQGLSRSVHWRVISRLTMAAFRNRKPSLESLRGKLGCDYVVSGRVYVASGRMTIGVELAEVQGQTVTWAGDAKGPLDDLFQEACPAIQELVDRIGTSLVAREIQRSRASPLPTLRSYSLLFGGVALMHRLSKADFDRSAQLLGALVERHPKSPEPQAWLAKWHVMRAAQGWSPDPNADAQAARRLTHQALDRQSDHSLALAVDGLASGFLLSDLETSEQRYASALAANPNEALAWLFLSALHTYKDRDEQAVEAAITAQQLSPLDPMRYFFDAFAANAMTAAGRYAEAIQLAQRSIRANCTHMPTYRALAIAQVLSGQGEAARQTIQRLLTVKPGYSVREFEQRYAGRGSKHSSIYREALTEAGLPAH